MSYIPQNSSETLSWQNYRAQAPAPSRQVWKGEGQAQREQQTEKNVPLNLNKQDSTPEQSAENSGLTFDDVIDVVNPLQHIPLVNMVYQHISGDEIGAAAQIIGGGIFGGPIGAAMGAVNAVVQHETGKGIAENALALVQPNDSKTQDTKLAGGLDGAPDINDPQAQLALVAQSFAGMNEIYAQAQYQGANPDIPPSANAFAPLAAKGVQAYEQHLVAQGRTAGHVRVVVDRVDAPHVQAGKVQGREGQDREGQERGAFSAGGRGAKLSPVTREILPALTRSPFSIDQKV